MLDFWSQSPESLHQITILMFDRGVPRSGSASTLRTKSSNHSTAPSDCAPGIPEPDTSGRTLRLHPVRSGPSGHPSLRFVLVSAPPMLLTRTRSTAPGRQVRRDSSAGARRNGIRTP